MGRGMMMQHKRDDSDSEDKEVEFEDEEDAQQKHSVATPRRTSEEGSNGGSNVAKDLAKHLSSKKKQLQSVPRKAPPINRPSSVINNVSKPKSNGLQRSNQTRANSSSSTSKILQSANRTTANLKVAPETIVAPTSKIAPDPKQAVANLRREPKPTNNVAQMPKQSVAALVAKTKTTIAKRKAVEDLDILQSKKAKKDDDFDDLFEKYYNKDNLDSDHDEKEVMTIDRLIEKAEDSLNISTGLFADDNPIDKKAKDEIEQVIRYTAKIATIHDKPNATGKEPRCQSPIWNTEIGALQMLHGLQELNILLCDILAYFTAYKAADDDQIIKMLAIYLTYQIPQNNKNQVNFDQDLEVMEKLIEKYISNGSLSNVFAETFPIDNHPLLGGWVELDGAESVKKRGKKDLDDESDVADGKYGARLLLLLAYMMASNVLDDESNNTQIRPAIRILGGKPEWKPVLRKLGQMIFLLSPDETISEYEECYKVCMNQFHFLNSYLFVNKVGVKKTQAQKRSPTSPKIQTSRALQRFAMMIMGGFFWNQYLQLPDDHQYKKYRVCKVIDKLMITIVPSQHIGDTLLALGLDIALRNWIKEHTGFLHLHDKKPRGKKDADPSHAKILEIEKQMRNIQTSQKANKAETDDQLHDAQEQIKDLKNQLRETQKEIKDLHRRQQSNDSLQTWFSLHKCLLEDFLHGSGAKNVDNDNLVQDEDGKENNEEDDDNDDDMFVSDGEEKGQEIQENVDDEELEVTQEQEIVMHESEIEKEMDESDNSSE